MINVAVDKKTPIKILMADDDVDDQMLAKEALQESRVLNELYFVSNGVELLAYLRGEGKFSDRVVYPFPSIVLLDLNMPKMDGREALAAIKKDKNIRAIPVVILTTSKAEEDMFKSYDLGAASYITKPVTFEALVELMKALGRYWVEFVELPNRH
jgi:two-component system response regulator